MGVLFQFDRLIKKYSIRCRLHRTCAEGKYLAGNWVPDPDPEAEDICGALLPMSARKVYQSGGTYTEQDKEFVTLAEILLEPEAYITHNGVKYQVQGNTDYSDYAGFYAYNLKRVGAFDRPEKD